MRIAAATALALLFVLPALPAQAAFHGVAWVATGVATKDNLPYTIDVAWGGFSFFTSGTNVFHVAVKDLSGTTVASMDFLGYEDFPYGNGRGYLEFLEIVGGSNDPAAQFSISGLQVAYTYSETLHQELSGTFNGYSFNVASVNYHYHF
jgi:hypothetical protein